MRDSIERANFTRQSPSIPARLARERRYHLIPLYHLLRLSRLGAEGIENSGSFRFADHIYAGRAEGRTVIGRTLDALLLALPSARSFRNRFEHVKRVTAEAIASTDDSVRILTVPAGIPRDHIELAAVTERRNVSWTCLDLDEEPLAIGKTLAREYGVAERFEWRVGDAFDRSSYPRELDIITSTGLTEFLDRDRVVRFLTLCFDALRPGGILVTSSTRRHRLSAFLMEQLAELNANYREAPEVEAILRETPFGSWTIERDAIGYQWLVVARRGE